MKMTLTSTLIASAVALATLSGAAHAKGRLVVYCSATIRNGSGSTLAKVDAEKKNPQADVWYGGTLDPQSQAGEMGLLQPYKSPNLEQVMEKFRDPAKVKGNLSSAVYVGILGFGANVSQYTKSGIAPARNAARGETAIGIGFLHDYSLEKEQGAPLELISPCEGTGYEIGGVSILKGARNLDNAKLFVDWVLSKDAQELAWKKGKSYQILTNTTAETSPNSLKLDDLKLINYDMDKYGSTDVRKALINKWVSEVKMGK